MLQTVTILNNLQDNNKMFGIFQVVAAIPQESNSTYNTIHVALLNKNVQSSLYDECKEQYNEKVKLLVEKSSNLDRFERSTAGRNIILHHQAAVANILRLQPLSWIVDKPCFEDKVRAGFSLSEEQESQVIRALQMASLRESAVKYIQKFVHLTVGGDCNQHVSSTNKVRLVRALDQW